MESFKGSRGEDNCERNPSSDLGVWFSQSKAHKLLPQRSRVFEGYSTELDQVERFPLAST